MVDGAIPMVVECDVKQRVVTRELQGVDFASPMEEGGDAR